VLGAALNSLGHASAWLHPPADFPSFEARYGLELAVLGVVSNAIHDRF